MSFLARDAAVDEFKVWWIWEPYFGLQTSTNQGALFGIGHGKVWLFAAASFVAIVGNFLLALCRRAVRDWLLTIALAVVMGGVLGNLHDRLGLWPMPATPQSNACTVRDWIFFQWPPWLWPNFNIADSLLVCGVTLLVWHALATDDAPSPKPTWLAQRITPDRRRCTQKNT